MARLWIIARRNSGTWAPAPVMLATSATTSATAGALINFLQPCVGDKPVTTSTPPVQIAASTPVLCRNSTARLSGPKSAVRIGSGR